MSPGRAVSVVIPTYNRQDSLIPAIRSALAQAQVEVEVLVCDDGSDDESAERVAQFADERVLWLPGTHTGGPAGPRNRGVAAAHHPWVAFLDSDDLWKPQKLTTQLDALAESGDFACVANALRVTPDDGVPSPLHVRMPAVIALRDELSTNLVITSSLIVRTDVLRTLGGFPERSPGTIFEDYAQWLRVAQTGPIVVVDEMLVEYRDDPAGSLRGRMSTQFRCTTNTFRDFLSWRGAQSPQIKTTPSEVATMAGHLARLMSLRDLAKGGATDVAPMSL